MIAIKQKIIFKDDIWYIQTEKSSTHDVEQCSTMYWTNGLKQGVWESTGTRLNTDSVIPAYLLVVLVPSTLRNLFENHV